jgi:NAD-dependent dihydropyrimidine dehydrogenase PreA subunit
MAIDKLDQGICTGCGICVAICPEDVLRMDESKKKAAIRYPDDCIACWSCELFCPVGCIEVSEPQSREVPPPY